MAKVNYRNRQGQLVDLSSVASTRVKNAFGTILEKAMHGGAIAITRHDAPKAVILSYDEFVWLARDRAPKLDDLSAEFDALLARMQTAKAKKGMAAAFNASPAELGRAAVKAARGNRQLPPKRPRKKAVR